MGGKTTSTTATKLNQISVQSSALGLPLAVGWGRGRITRPNLIWYGGFRAISHTTKTSGGKGLGGGSSNTTYTYTASIMLALCEGGAAGIRGVVTTYRDSSILAGASGAGLSLATGAPTQSVWGYLTSLYPSQALAYSGIAYVYAQDYALSDSATLPNHSFEVDFAEQLGGGIVDADPKNVITGFLTSAQYGVPGWSSGLIADLSDYSLYCRASGLLLSPVLESQATASSILAEWLLATNSFAVWSEGVLKIRPYGDAAVTGNGVTWTPNLAPEYDLTEDDMIADGDGCPVQQTINDQSDAYNIVQLEFLDRANQYNSAIATAQDLANIVEFGSRKQDPTTVHSICDAGVAQIAAQLYLQRTLYVREGYTTQLSWNFALLEPGDLVTLTTLVDELQLSRELVRIVQIDEDEDGLLSITCEGLDIGTASAALYSSHSAQGYQANTNVAPGSVTTAVLLEAVADLTGFDPEVWVAVSSLSPTWGGCNVWISGDGNSYRQIGTINEAARYGVLTADLPLHADPDNSNTLAVDLSESLGTLAGGTAAEMNAGATLAAIGGEIIAYENATLTGANHYSLAPLRRGLHGTAAADHPAGSPFVRLDDAVFKSGFRDLNVGQTIYLKFASFNLWGKATEDLSLLDPFTMTVSAAASRYSQVSQVADDAAAAAQAAQADATAALGHLSIIASDGYLNAGSEKRDAVQDWTAIDNEVSPISAQATALGISPATLDAAKVALDAYLNSLSPAWNDATQNTAIVAATWNGKWTDYYFARQQLLDAIAQAAAQAVSTVNRIRFSGFEAGQSGWDAPIFNPAALVIHDVRVDSYLSIKYLGMRADATASGQTVSFGTHQTDPSFFFPVTPGETLSVGAGFQTYGPCGTQTCDIYYFNADGTVNGHVGGASRTGTHAYGDRLWFKDVVPAGAVLARVEWYAGSNGAGTLDMALSQPMVCAVSASQMAEPTFIPGPNSHDGSDVTSLNTSLDTQNVNGRPAETVLAEIDAIGSDGILSKGEKPQLYRDWTDLYQTWETLDAKAGSLGIAATERSNASAAITTLQAFLTGLSPSWTDTTQDTPITAATLQTDWTNATGAVAALQAAIQGQPGENGTNGVSPSPKYTAFDVAGEGTWACSYPIPLASGQTLTVNTDFTNSFSSTHASPATITSQIQYSLDGGSTWSAMSGGTVSSSVSPVSSGGDLVEFAATGTYTASGSQNVHIRVVVTRTGNSDAQFGYNHGFGQPS